MRKKILGVLSVILVVVFCVGLTACSKKTDLPDWAFESLRAEDNSLSEGSNLRVMSANVLVHMEGWGGTPVRPRAQMFAEAVKHYTPDVIALQEFCGCWYDELPPRLENYRLLDTGKKDYTTIMYNADSVELIDEGILRYSKQANPNCRFIVWGVFKKIETGEKFIVTSTHWETGVDGKFIDIRDRHVAEHCNLIADLQSNHNAPLFAMGDYNAFEKDREGKNDGAKWYNDFVSKSGYIDAKFIEGIERKPLDEVVYEDNSWDHIFVDKTTEIKGFGILYNDFYEALSDHPLIFADAKI